MGEKRVIVLGFDGADWNIINDLKKELPNFSKLAEKGILAPLKSTIPPISPPAWSSIVTGLNPGKHGVYEFVEFDKKSFSKKIRFNPIRAKKIWNYLDEAGYRSIIINFPLMYPPEKINGITVSGLLTPSSAKYFTYPEKLTEKLKSMGYEVEISETELFKLLYSNKEKLYNRLIQIMKKRAEISIRLLSMEDWDFSMIVFGETDRIQHFFWNEKEKIRQGYKTIDRILGEFINKIIDDHTILIVVSDHGFKGIKKYFYINSWLLQKGLLSIKRLNKHKASRTDIREKILRALGKLHLKGLIKYVPDSLGKVIPDSKLHSDDIDVNNTRAYCWSAYGYLTLNGDWNEEAKSKLEKDLLKITDPEDGSKVIKKAFKKEEIFSGKYLDYAPDLVLVTNNGYFLQDKYLNKELFSTPDNTPGLAKRFGEHSDLGILLIYDPEQKLNVKREYKIYKVYDVTPTILSLYNLGNDVKFDGYNILA